MEGRDKDQTSRGGGGGTPEIGVKLGETGETWEKVRKSGKNGKKWLKVAKKVAKSGELW